MIRRPPAGYIVELVRKGRARPIYVTRKCRHQGDKVSYNSTRRHLGHLHGPHAVKRRGRVNIHTNAHKPIARNFSTTLPRVFFNLNTVLRLTTTVLRPKARILEVSLDRFKCNIAIPVTGATFTCTEVVIRFNTVRCVYGDLYNNVHATRVKARSSTFINFQPTVSM